MRSWKSIYMNDKIDQFSVIIIRIGLEKLFDNILKYWYNEIFWLDEKEREISTKLNIAFIVCSRAYLLLA